MAAKLMHVVQYGAYGGGPAGLKVPIPSPKKVEVLLKLEAASINPVDWKIQKGVARPLFPHKFPYIPVTDVAGEVVEVGQGVQKFQAGDKVVAYLHINNGGRFAEYATASESLTVTRPLEVSAAEAAGVKRDGTSPQKNILVAAASSGVGQYAVQLVKLGNTHV